MPISLSNYVFLLSTPVGSCHDVGVFFFATISWCLNDWFSILGDWSRFVAIPLNASQLIRNSITFLWILTRCFWRDKFFRILFSSFCFSLLIRILNYVRWYGEIPWGSSEICCYGTPIDVTVADWKLTSWFPSHRITSKANGYASSTALPRKSRELSTMICPTFPAHFRISSLNRTLKSTPSLMIIQSTVRSIAMIWDSVTVLPQLPVQ